MEPTAIQHLMSAIRQNTSGTKHIPKLPPKLIGKDKEVIQAVLMERNGGRRKHCGGRRVDDGPQVEEQPSSSGNPGIREVLAHERTVFLVPVRRQRHL